MHVHNAIHVFQVHRSKCIHVHKEAVWQLGEKYTVLDIYNSAVQWDILVHVGRDYTLLSSCSCPAFPSKWLLQQYLLSATVVCSLWLLLSCVQCVHI